jgi:hypothetical protein
MPPKTCLFLEVCGIGDSPIEAIAVWLMLKKEFTTIYISEHTDII